MEISILRGTHNSPLFATFECLIYLASYVTSFTRTYMAQLSLNIVRLSLMMLITVSPNQLVSKVLQIFVPRSECLQVNFQCLINAMKVY